LSKNGPKVPFFAGFSSFLKKCFGSQIKQLTNIIYTEGNKKSMVLKTIFLYIPTAIFAVFVLLALYNIPTRISTILTFGTLIGLSTLIIRDVLSLYGPHIILITVINIALFSILFKQTVMVSFMVRAAGLIALMLGEALVTRPILLLLKIDPLSTLTNTGLHIAAGWISHLPLLIVLLALSMLGRRKPRFSEKGEVFFEGESRV